jgi:cellobiose phosphorylase
MSVSRKPHQAIEQPVRVEAHPDAILASPFGHFSSEGDRYIITRPDTPRPWVNVICPGDYGLVISQAGGGYSWRTHAGLNRATRFDQDLITDHSGKFIYIRDEADGSFWSPTWQPVGADYDMYQCEHGIGYTRFHHQRNAVTSDVLIFVPPGEPLEIWRLELTNESNRERHLSLWTYLEWCLGAPDAHREFHRTFIETDLSSTESAIFARKHLWDIPDDRGRHWNRSWPYTAFHACSEPTDLLCGSKDAFIGPYRSVARPGALSRGEYLGPTTGRWDDGIGSIRCDVTLKPGETRTVHFMLGMAETRKEADQLVRRYRHFDAVETARADVAAFWDQWLQQSEVDTPDPAVNVLLNHWLKYQTLSARLWGRTAYYQTGGAFGFRDQLQDSLLMLHVDPNTTRNQITLHAGHQFSRGHVHHWWHPITGEGLESGYSDDLLWLPFAVCAYVKETGDCSVLRENVPFLDGADESDGTIHEHCCRAIELALARRSERGLPLIGTGDWNDGLSAAGFDGRGESVWVAQFLVTILCEYENLVTHAVNQEALSSADLRRIADWPQIAGELTDRVNELAWDGRWFIAGTCDDGSPLGSHTCEGGQIFLNTQTWAIISGIVDEPRLGTMLKAVEERLYRDYGPLLLWPAYDTPDPRIGYLTRYAPGVRENGGVYTHAATWAIQAECMLKRNDKAWRIFRSLAPPYRGMEPLLYQCEPYVTPGNIDGPDSPWYGRGGWTWYTGSAAWLYRVLVDWMIGVRATWDGLLIDPCLPSHWNTVRLKRVFRHAIYHVRLHKLSKDAASVAEVRLDGRMLPTPLIPAGERGTEHQVDVLME